MLELDILDWALAWLITHSCGSDSCVHSDDLAPEVKLRRDERLEFIVCVRRGGFLRGVEDYLEEHMQLELVESFGFGAVGCCKDRISDSTSSLFLDSVNDTFLGADGRQSCHILAVCLLAGVG